MFFLWRKSILLCFCWFCLFVIVEFLYFLLMSFVFVEVMYFVYKHLQTKPAKFNKLNTKVTFQILEKASLSLEKKETRGLDITSLLSKCLVFLIYCFSHVYGHLRIRAPRGYPRIVGECKKKKKKKRETQDVNHVDRLSLSV